VVSPKDFGLGIFGARLRDLPTVLRSQIRWCYAKPRMCDRACSAAYDLALGLAPSLARRFGGGVRPVLEGPRAAVVGHGVLARCRHHELVIRCLRVTARRRTAHAPAHPVQSHVRPRTRTPRPPTCRAGSVLEVLLPPCALLRGYAGAAPRARTVWPRPLLSSTAPRLLRLTPSATGDAGERSALRQLHGDVEVGPGDGRADLRHRDRDDVAVGERRGHTERAVLRSGPTWSRPAAMRGLAGEHRHTGRMCVSGCRSVLRHGPPGRRRRGCAASTLAEPVHLAADEHLLAADQEHLALPGCPRPRRPRSRRRRVVSVVPIAETSARWCRTPRRWSCRSSGRRAGGPHPSERCQRRRRRQ
jgi:hypothetical protein